MVQNSPHKLPERGYGCGIPDITLSQIWNGRLFKDGELVLSGDEKTNIQARARRHPPYPSGQTQRRVWGKECTMTLHEPVNGKIEPAPGIFFQGLF